MDDLLATATIGASFGLTGEVKLYPNNPSSGYLRKLKTVTLESPNGTRRQVDIVSIRKAGGQLVVKFEGFDSPEAARALARCILLVPRGQAYPLKEGEVYAADLEGCSVTWQGSALGKVVSLVEGPQALLLEVEKNDGTKQFIPYMEHFIDGVDSVNREIRLKVDWILQ